MRGTMRPSLTEWEPRNSTEAEQADLERRIRNWQEIHIAAGAVPRRGKPAGRGEMPVIGPDGRPYPGIGEAARQNGCSRQAIAHYARNRLHGWRFA